MFLSEWQLVKRSATETWPNLFLDSRSYSVLETTKCGYVYKKMFRILTIRPVRNIPKFKDRANWSRDTFQPMRRRPCVYQQTNQNIAPVIKNFQNNGRSRTESVIVSRFSGIFLRLSWGIDNFFKWTAYRKLYWKGLVKYSAHFVVYSSFIF